MLSMNVVHHRKFILLYPKVADVSLQQVTDKDTGVKLNISNPAFVSVSVSITSKKLSPSLKSTLTCNTFFLIRKLMWYGDQYTDESILKT